MRFKVLFCVEVHEMAVWAVRPGAGQFTGVMRPAFVFDNGNHGHGTVVRLNELSDLEFIHCIGYHNPEAVVKS